VNKIALRVSYHHHHHHQQQQQHHFIVPFNQSS